MAQAIGRSRGGLNTKVVALADAMGRLVKFVLQPGNATEYVVLPGLVGGVAAQELIADKAYDTGQFRSWLTRADIRPVIPSRPRRRQPAWPDPAVYGVRVLYHFAGGNGGR